MSGYGFFASKLFLLSTYRGRSASVAEEAFLDFCRKKAFAETFGAMVVHHSVYERST